MLTLLHTADAHVETFDSLRDRIAPDARLHHLVRPDFLSRAGQNDPALAGDIATTITAAITVTNGPVICTCTTIADFAEAAGATRIDRPMMARAAAIGGPVLLVYCLQSTAETSQTALKQALDSAGKTTGETAAITPLFLPQYWPFFTGGEPDEFHAMLAAAITASAQKNPPACIVLAQASMAGAGAKLAHLGLPVLSSPELALRSGLGLPA